MKFEYERTKIQDIIKELRNLTDITIKEKGLIPIYEMKKKLPQFYTDKSRLLQVLSNLISNAEKYTEKGHIKTEIFKKDDFIHFKISDTGTGISEYDQKRVFSRYGDNGK